jgi:ribosomal protein S18 acetylase RimI-like enzyme
VAVQVEDPRRRPAQSPKVSLRTITQDDEPFVRDVYASTREAEMAVVDWDERTRMQFLDLQYRAQSHHYATNYPHAEYDVVLVDGVPAGRLYVDRSGEHLQLLDIAMLAPYRSQGVGTGLILQLMEEARRDGGALRCYVERFNRAWGLYHRLGFRPLEETGMYVQLQWTADGAASGDAPRDELGSGRSRAE